jgi:hypothetical protein
MRASSDELSPLDDLPPLPASLTTKDGAVFDPRPDEWTVANIQFGSNNRINFVRFNRLTDTGSIAD